MKFLKILNERIEEWILILIYIAMLIIASAQIIFRYVINSSLSWSQDLLTYMLIWSVFIGIPLAVKKRRHIKVELLYSMVPEKMHFSLKVLSNIVFMLFCVIIAYFSIIKVYKLIFINPQMSESTGLPMWAIQMAVPLGFALTIYRMLEDTVLLFKENSQDRKGGMGGC